MEMEREFIGQANHVFKNSSITFITVDAVSIGKSEQLESFVSIQKEDSEDSIIIHSIEQLKQLNALVIKAFSWMEE